MIREELPTNPSCQNNLSSEERNFLAVKLIMLDIGLTDIEKPIYEYYLGREDPSDGELELDEEDPQQTEVSQHQDSVPSPILINFCDTSDQDPEVISINSDSLCDDTNTHSNMDSPLESKHYSPEDSMSCVDDTFEIMEENHSIVNISQADSGYIGEAGCENQIETPIKTCMPTTSATHFSESFDNTHKSNILEDHSNTNKLSVFPMQSSLSHTITCYNDQLDIVSHSLRAESSKKRRRRSDSSSSRSRHSTDPYYTDRPARHGSLAVPYGRNRANSTHETNRLVDSPIRTRASYSDCTPLRYSYTDQTQYFDPGPGPHNCPECDYISDANQVIEHYCDTHFSLTCPKCDNSFSEPHFFQHCRNCEASKPELQCPDCEITCSDSSIMALAMHIKFTHPIKTCVVCGDSFVPQKFVKHARTCFFLPKHECTCPYCEKELDFIQLNEHLVTHPIAECPLCYKDIALPEAREHMESCYLDKVNGSEESLLGTVLNCPKCKLLLTYECMADHLIQKHLSIICVFCYEVLSRDEMREHIVSCCQRYQSVNRE